MKWIGQHIYDLVSRFRDDVYLEDLSTTTETSVLVVDSTGKISKSKTLADDIIESEIDTLAGLTSFGSAGATTNILAGDVTMYNAVNDGNPTLSIGSSATNRFEIKTPYNSGTQSLCDVVFTTYTDSGTSNDGRFLFYIDEVYLAGINDVGLFVYGSGAIQAAGDGAVITAHDTTTSSATEGGRLRLRSDDGAAMGDNHRLGAIEFYGAEDGSTTLSIGARIQAIARDAWDGSNNDADLEFYTTDGTTESKVLTLDADKLATFTGGVTIAGDIDLAGDIDVDGTLETDALTIGGAAVLAQATASAVGAVELATDAEAVTATDTTKAVTPANLKARVSQIINLKGYCVLEDDNYLFAEDFTDAQAPWQLAQDYTSGTIGSGTEVAQTLFMKAGGFHVPVACVMNSIQVQAAVNGSGGGNITVAIVEYRPSEHADDRDDYPRTVYEEVVVASNNNASKIKTVSVASGALDNTAIPAGSHLLIMVKGDSDTDGDTAQVSVAIEIRW